MESDIPNDIVEFGQKWLSPAVTEALVHKLKLTSLNSIQKKAIPAILSGSDVLITSKTGTGKSLASLIPIIDSLINNKNLSSRLNPRVLIIAPTSELCVQLYEVTSNLIYFLQNQIRAVLKISHGSIADNTTLSKHQKKLVEKYERKDESNDIELCGDILICTPSSFINADNINDIHTHLKILLIDECDLLFLMGFEEEMDKIVKILKPNLEIKNFQTIILSATLDQKVNKLNGMLLHKPTVIDRGDETDSVGVLSELVIKVNENDKFLVLYVFLRFSVVPTKCLIFVNSIERAYSLKILLSSLQINCIVISPILGLETRTSIINSFNKGTFKILIASPDKQGGRGIDFKGVLSVVNLDAPDSPKVYTHRIGRTARAGSNGVSLTFIGNESDHFLLSKEGIQNISIPSSILDQLRYRFEDVMKNVTPNVLNSVQLQAISKSALACSQLKDYFETNRGDFEALQIYASQTDIKAIKDKNHLYLIPSYLLSDNLMSTLMDLRKFIYNSANIPIDDSETSKKSFLKKQFKGGKQKSIDDKVDYSTTAPEYLPSLSKNKRSKVAKSLKSLIPKKKMHKIKSKKQKRIARQKKTNKKK